MNNVKVFNKCKLLSSWRIVISALFLFCSLLSVRVEAAQNDPFENLDLFGPFLNRPNSKVGSAATTRLSNVLINKLSELLPGIPQGKPVRSGGWTEYCDVNDRLTSNWGSHSIDYTVYEFSSSESAKQAIDAIFSDKFKTALKMDFDKLNQEAIQNVQVGKFGSALTAKEFRSLNLKPGTYKRTYTTGFNYEINISNDIASCKYYSLITNHRRVITGNRDQGGTDYNTITLTSDKWMQGEEKTAFMISGQYVLAVTVSLLAVQQPIPVDPITGQGPFVNIERPPFPNDIWDRVLKIIRENKQEEPVTDISVHIVTGSLFDNTANKKLNPGDLLPWNHVLLTDKENVVAISGSKMSFQINPMTKFSLIGKTPTQSQNSIFLFFGRIWALFHRKDINIETYNSVAGCEGTSFDIAYETDNDLTTVSVFDGIVSLKSKSNKQSVLKVNADMQATMDNNGKYTLTKLPAGYDDPAIEVGEIDTKSVDTDYDNTENKADDSIFTIIPTADSHVYAYSYLDWNKANWGKHEILTAGWHPTGGEKRIYLKFDLSGVNPENVKNAVLRLFQYHKAGSNTLTLGIYRITSPWTEGRGTYKPASEPKPGEITWLNQPTFNPTPAAQFKPETGVNKWVEIDITTLVKAWLSGTPNYGLVIKAEGNLSGTTAEAQYGFYSREYKDSNKRPELILSETDTQTPPDIDNSLPFFDDFNSGLSNWEIKDKNAALGDGKLYWNSGQFQLALLKRQIPMENVVIEFDGYCETNGLNVYLQNDKNEGYIVILGGWFNTQSASDAGKNGQNRQLVAGKVWEPKQWHHYKIERDGDSLRAFCDGRKIIDRTTTMRFPGTGYLKFDSWNARIGIDNIKIYRINGSNVGSETSFFWENGMPEINFGSIGINGDFTITTRHKWIAGKPLAYVSLLIEDSNKTKLVYAVYNTVNTSGGHVPSNHFGLYASGKNNLSKQDCIDAGKNGSVRLTNTLYSSLLPGTNTVYNALSCSITWKTRFHNIPTGKKTVRIRQVYMDESGGWQQIGSFNVTGN